MVEIGRKPKDGLTGLNGLDGIAGLDGLSFLSNDGPPAESVGRDDELYLDLIELFLYKKIRGQWLFQLSLKPKKGKDGKSGEDGKDGVTQIIKSGSILSASTDHHSGFSVIENLVTIEQNKQMINFTALDINGNLNLEGDLWLA